MNRIKVCLLPLALAGCSQGGADAPAGPSFGAVMKDGIAGGTERVWEITNEAVGEQGGLDPALLDDAKWDALATRAEAVRDAALKIATMDPIVVVKDGETLGDADNPEAHSAAEIQSFIDKNPQGMRDMARALADHVGNLAAAARAHDAAKAGPLVDNLDGVCESCHLQYWYPEDAAAQSPAGG